MASTPEYVPLEVRGIDRLDIMMATQAEFQQKINGYPLSQQDDETRIKNFKVSMLALTDELHEALHEMGWKEWATSRHFNGERVKSELIDAWHFFMNLCLHAGMTPDELFRGYQEKQIVNRQRQYQGYDGVSTKCPRCKGAYDDKSTRCVPHNPSLPAYCAMFQGHYSQAGDPMVPDTQGNWSMAGAA
jgi:dimeric dUTPase (all-alpha-NTP-PPase superfamily)